MFVLCASTFDIEQRTAPHTSVSSIEVKPWRKNKHNQNMTAKLFDFYVFVSSMLRQFTLCTIHLKCQRRFFFAFSHTEERVVLLWWINFKAKILIWWNCENYYEKKIKHCGTSTLLLLLPLLSNRDLSCKICNKKSLNSVSISI